MRKHGTPRPGRGLPAVVRAVVRAGLSAGLAAGLALGGVAGALAGPVAAARAAPARCGGVTARSAAEVFAPLPGRLKHERTPGAVVAVVSGGRTVFSDGYGMADVERRVAFDPARSLVRIASITKLITFTAVMQQVETGRLDLDADVNRYLTTFKIPAAYPKPVTIRDLMDHTAGFEDRIIGTGARSAADVPPLGDYLAANVPQRIRPPGEVSAYSNYGAALAGYLVELVSGEPYDEYVRRHVLDPLGMAHTTATEPVPPSLAGDLARSYNSDAGPIRRVPFQFDPLAPDGAVSAAAEDMARFMTFHLRPADAAAVLRPETVARMHRTSFAADPRLDGYAHGFKEKTINGRRALIHDGGWEGFLSMLVLMPECDLGLFLSVNGTSGVEAASDVVDAFFDRFAPAAGAGSTGAGTPAAGPDGTGGDGSDAPTSPAPLAAGFYAPTRRNESTMERVLTLLGPRRLSADADGTVHFKGETWRRRGGVYGQVDGEERLSFRAGSAGRRYVVTDTSTYELLGRADTPPVNLAAVGLFLLTALSALAIPVVWLWRRLRPGRRHRASTRRWSVARWSTGAAALLGLGFLAGLVATLAGYTGDYLYGAPLGFRLLLTVPLVAVSTGTAGAVATIAGWRGSGAGVMARVHQVALLIGLAALTWFVLRWNLVGWWAA